MHGTCNHIAGVLFRVENAVKTGETKTSSTSMKSRWNVPSSKPQTKDAVAVMDVTWKKGHYRKNPAEVEDERRKHSLKLNFTPLNKRQTEEVKNITKLKNDLYNLVKEDVPNSCFILTIEKRHITAKVDPQMPHSLGEIANRLDPEASDPRGEFLQRIAISKEQCGVLSEATVEQSNSKAWNEHRKGRVTASLFHRISSRVDTLHKHSSADPTKLVDAILRQKESHPTTAMKHGLSLEPHAKKAYTQVMRKNHKKFKSKNTGLLVSSANPASADLEIECQCCGKGLCEIKCPESIKDTAPSSSNQAYLIEESGKVQVSKNHAYFYQIQGQMAIHGRQYCDLFVYTYHGSVTVRVMFEKEFWDVLEEKLSWFWLSHVLPALLNWNCNDNKTTDNTKENPKTPTKIQTLSRSHAVCRALEPLSPKDNSKNIQQPKKRRRLNKVPIYLCGMCGLDCVDEPQSEADQSVSCDVCGVWVHYICAQVTDTHLETVDLWSCGKCSK
ncbi:uncharacterized protein LOC127866911 [Dreissena polymorpha]|uniref:uncharacterized protein LOC127866911 n=1 Tax=Dreissena polymorpha TaxID=45954 RepID=UPI002264130E|nr:uncharacterized protein LOC127866911 [Dreissena polymorpha]